MDSPVIPIPLFAVGKSETDEEGQPRLRGIHGTTLPDGAKCLMFFTTEEKATSYKDRKPNLSEHLVGSAPSKLDLELLIADCRQLGAKALRIDEGRPIDLADFARVLDSLEK
jgi:hypothetical protein